MIQDPEVLARIERSVRHYLDRCITRGEALDEVIDTLEAGGRLLDGEEASLLLPEARSWCPTGRAKPAKARAAPASNRRDQRPQLQA